MLKVFPAVLITVALGGASLGCLGSLGSTPAVVAREADPTPLAKCQVKKSQASPLVTEWPASEKAHLEGMLSERTVVVSYSGCELRILDSCRVQGGYKFTRTSLANDTIEISDADELYAKLPLGAVSLEGELEKTGRLAVRTTIAGQLRLDAESPVLPDNGACRDATHVVAALSVGAFEMLSGGSTKVGGGAGVVGVGSAGARSSSEESLLRSAGDGRACKRTSKEPDADCRSPIQLFLEPVDRSAMAKRGRDGDGDSGDSGGGDSKRDRDGDNGRGNGSGNDKRDRDGDDASKRDRDEDTERAAARPTRREPSNAVARAHAEPPADKSVEVEFTLPDDGGKWNLLAADGTLLCELPCTRRVANSSGLRLQLDAARREDIKVVAVPPDLGYSPGRRVKAVPHPVNNPVLAGYGFYGGILGAVTGGVMAAASCKSDETTGVVFDADRCYAGIGIGGASLVLGTVAGIYWYKNFRAEALEMTLIEDASGGLRLGPGYLRF